MNHGGDMNFIGCRTAINDDVGVATHNQFPGAFDSSRPAHARIVLEQVGILADLLNNAASSGWTVSGDLVMYLRQAISGGRRPAQAHQFSAPCRAKKAAISASGTNSPRSAASRPARIPAICSDSNFR